ncbi:MAG: hypothetical protein ACXWWE_08620 [Nitrospira sp.]
MTANELESRMRAGDATIQSHGGPQDDSIPTFLQRFTPTGGPAPISEAEMELDQH